MSKNDVEKLEAERLEFESSQLSIRGKQPVSFQAILDKLEVTNKLLQTIIDNQVKSIPKEGVK